MTECGRPIFCGVDTGAKPENERLGPIRKESLPKKNLARPKAPSDNRPVSFSFYPRATRLFV